MLSGIDKSVERIGVADEPESISKASDGRKGDVLARRKSATRLRLYDQEQRLATEHLRDYEAHCARNGHISPSKSA